VTDSIDKTLSYADATTTHPGKIRAPYLILAVHAKNPLAPSARLFLSDVDRVSVGRGKGRGYHRSTGEDGTTLRVDVVDNWMSSSHATISQEGERWVLRDDSSKNGTLVGGKRATEHVLADGDQFVAGHTVFVFYREGQRDVGAPSELELDGSRSDVAPLSTLSPSLAQDFQDVARIAISHVPVLLFGETGTGKEVTARAIHDMSRRAGPFVAINCGALPDNLIESELFGYRKGAFSGASEDRKGLIRAANGGTLFLDEIAELPESSQIKLLRVLQEESVLPLGATESVSVDLRVIAATHQDLSERIEAEQFREDLYARLQGFEFVLPALRERRQDLGFLIAALLSRHGHTGVELDIGAATALLAYDWPRNVRELEQALNTAVALAAGEPVTVEHLPRNLREAAADTSRETSGKDDQLRASLVAALQQHSGNVSAVARELGKARVQIRRWCKRFDIDSDTYRS